MRVLACDVRSATGEAIKLVSPVDHACLGSVIFSFAPRVLEFYFYGKRNDRTAYSVVDICLFHLFNQFAMKSPLDAFVNFL